MVDSERARLIEIVKTGRTSETDAEWDSIQLSDMTLWLRRAGVVLSMDNKDSSFYAHAFTDLAKTAEKITRGNDFEQLTLPDSATIDRIVELYSEPKCSPELLERKKNYVLALAKLTYGQY